MMGREIEVAPLRADGNIVAVILEDTEIAGHRLVACTARESVSVAPLRRWFPEPAEAIAFAAEFADAKGVPLIDLREPGND